MEKPNVCCSKCLNIDWAIKERKMANGRVYYPWVCRKCGRISSFAAKKKSVFKLIEQWGMFPEKI